MPKVTTLSQEVVDSVDIEDHGELVYLDFVWADTRDRAKAENRANRFAALTDTRRLRRKASRKKLKTPVSDLCDAPRYTILSDEGLRLFTELAYEEVRDHEKLALTDDDARALPDEELSRRAFYFCGYDNSWTALGAARPANRVYAVDSISGPSARNYHTHVLEPLLEAHPWVISSTHDRGRPGSYDHVPAGTNVCLLLPEDVYQALDADPRRLAHRRSIERGYAKPHPAAPQMDGLTSQEIADALFNAPRYESLHGVLGPDPLGIKEALREQEYVEPGDEY